MRLRTKEQNNDGTEVVLCLFLYVCLSLSIYGNDKNFQRIPLALSSIASTRLPSLVAVAPA